MDGDCASLSVDVGEFVCWGAMGEHVGVVRYFTSDLKRAFVERIGGRRGEYVRVAVADLRRVTDSVQTA